MGKWVAAPTFHHTWWCCSLPEKGWGPLLYMKLRSLGNVLFTLYRSGISNWMTILLSSTENSYDFSSANRNIMYTRSPNRLILMHARWGMHLIQRRCLWWAPIARQNDAPPESSCGDSAADQDETRRASPLDLGSRLSLLPQCIASTVHRLKEIDACTRIPWRPHGFTTICSLRSKWLLRALVCCYTVHPLNLLMGHGRSHQLNCCDLFGHLQFS
jgi:hypothetical protein